MITPEVLLIILCAPVAAIALAMLAIGTTFKIDKNMFADMELDSEPMISENSILDCDCWDCYIKLPSDRMF